MTVKVELGFTADGQGAPFFTLDDPTLGVLDSQTVFLGGGEVFVEVTEYFQTYALNRGKSRELDKYESGQATVAFENAERVFDPTFEASPYFGQIVPKRQIRISNEDIVQYQGVIEDWNINYEPGGQSIAVAQAFDSFSYFSNVTFGEVTFPAQETATRINAVLDEVGWSATARDIAFTGATQASGTVEAETPALDYLQTVSRGEPGELFMAKNNDVKLVGRNAAFTSDGLSFTDDGTGIDYKTIEAIFGSELLFNEVTTTSSAGTAVSTNDTSVQIYGERDLVRETFLSSEFQLQQLADYLVTRFGEPEFRFEGITVDLRAKEESVKQDILDLELGEVIKVTFTPNDIPPAIVRYGRIIGIQQSVTPESQEIIFKLQTTEGGLFVLNDNVFGRLDEGNLLGW